MKRRLKEEEFWSELEESVDGSEYIPELRERFSEKYKPKGLLEAIRYLYMKPGHIHNRKLISEKPEEIPINSSIFCWSEDGVSYAESNMMFYFANDDFSGNVYWVKSQQDLNSLAEIICKENKIPQAFKLYLSTFK